MEKKIIIINKSKNSFIVLSSFFMIVKQTFLNEFCINHLLIQMQNNKSKLLSSYLYYLSFPSIKF